MKNYLLLILSFGTTLLAAQHSIFSPEEHAAIYNYYLDDRPYDLLPLETFTTEKFLHIDKEEVFDFTENMRDHQLKIVFSDSGFLFFNSSPELKTTSYGLMKEVEINFNYIEDSEDIEQQIRFNWHFQNSYNELTGIAPVKISRRFNPDGENASIQVWIDVPADQRRKYPEDRDGYTLFLKGERNKKAGLGQRSSKL